MGHAGAIPTGQIRNVGSKRTFRVFGEEAMWMRSCAVCKALMMKLRLSAVGVGGSGSGRDDPNWRIAVDQDAGILQDEGEAVMAREIEFRCEEHTSELQS